MSTYPISKSIWHKTKMSIQQLSARSQLVIGSTVWTFQRVQHWGQDLESAHVDFQRRKESPVNTWWLYLSWGELMDYQGALSCLIGTPQPSGAINFLRILILTPTRHSNQLKQTQLHMMICVTAWTGWGARRRVVQRRISARRVLLTMSSNQQRRSAGQLQPPISRGGESWFGRWGRKRWAGG